VGLERGSLSLVSTIEELLEREINGSGLEILEYGRRDPSRQPRGSLYPQRLALTSLTNGGRSVGIVQVAPCTHEAEWIQTHYYSENIVARGIEPGISGSLARNSDH
jgi:hypothetical protein